MQMDRPAQNSAFALRPPRAIAFDLDGTLVDTMFAFATLAAHIMRMHYGDELAEAQGRYLETSRRNFVRTMDISCFSFTGVARRAAPLMATGGSLLTITFAGSERVVPSYNVMGVAKAALEASVRYLAVDLGGQRIRVNALSSGPMRTLAGAAISDARYVYRWARENAPLRRNATLAEVGSAGLYLLSDLSHAVTGEVHYVDCGVHVVGIAAPDTSPASDVD